MSCDAAQGRPRCDGTGMSCYPSTQKAHSLRAGQADGAFLGRKSVPSPRLSASIPFLDTEGRRPRIFSGGVRVCIGFFHTHKSGHAEQWGSAGWLAGCGPGPDTCRPGPSTCRIGHARKTKNRPGFFRGRRGDGVGFLFRRTGGDGNCPSGAHCIGSFHAHEILRRDSDSRVG
jgi:hypothetical protein